MRTLFLLAAAAAGWWWWKRRQANKPPAPGTTTAGVVATLFERPSSSAGRAADIARILDPVGLGTTVPTQIVNPAASHACGPNSSRSCGVAFTAFGIKPSKAPAFPSYSATMTRSPSPRLPEVKPTASPRMLS